MADFQLSELRNTQTSAAWQPLFPIKRASEQATAI
jgi:hypothetical protein